MKVTLRQSYSWKSVVVDPTEQTYSPEFVVDMQYKDVLEILRVQVEMEALQQRLAPLYKAAEERVKEAAEAKKYEEEMEAAAKETDEELNVRLAADPEYVELHKID